MTVNMSSAGIMYAKISESVQTDPFGGRLTDEEYRVKFGYNFRYTLKHFQYIFSLRTFCNEKNVMNMFEYV